jgi:hypothetical protein
MTICIDYADYLAQTLPQNRRLFSTYYIITERTDAATCELARAYDCVLLFTSKKHEKGAKFNKSGMMFDAQHFIHKRHGFAWIAHVDADIYLPADLWKHLRVDALNKNGIYGITRHVYTTHDDYVHDRIASVDKGEMGVIGYFQLYWLKNKFYPPWSANCSHCDLVFQNGFRIRETFHIVCFHFGEKRMNWNGRVAELWNTAPVPELAPTPTPVPTTETK